MLLRSYGLTTLLLLDSYNLFPDNEAIRNSRMTPKEKRAKESSRPRNSDPRFAKVLPNHFQKYITRNGPEWFSKDSLEMVARLRHALHNYKSEGSKLALELKNAGYRPPPLREGIELTDQVLLQCYHWEAYSALWP